VGPRERCDEAIRLIDDVLTALGIEGDTDPRLAPTAVLNSAFAGHGSGEEVRDELAASD
jgi:hypothetical protein